MKIWSIAINFGDEETITYAIDEASGKVISRYAPSTYSASEHGVSYDGAVDVTAAMSAADRGDTIYSYTPSSYKKEEYIASRHSYTASSYTASSYRNSVSNSGGFYVKSGDSYVKVGSWTRAYFGYSASSYTKESHSYTASKYTESVYERESLKKKRLHIQYKPSTYERETLKAQTASATPAKVTTQNVTALTT